MAEISFGGNASSIIKKKTIGAFYTSLTLCFGHAPNCPDEKALLVGEIT